MMINKVNKTSGGDTACYILELQKISKSFGLVQANKNIDLQIETGTIHGIIGENGAGKSTLMNILYGLHRADSGEMLIDGSKVKIKSSADALSLGIGMVHQHFMLINRFSVLENVMLGSEGGSLLSTGKITTVNKLKELGQTFDMEVDPYALVSDLNVGMRQRVEILKALKGGAKILILDEPTGVLTPQEATQLFGILDKLRENGVTVLLITHKYMRNLKNKLRYIFMFGLSLAPVLSANIAYAEIPYTTFESIDGGIIDTNDWRGKPYLIVNTASKCGFTRQYAPLQKLYDRFHDQGLQMIAVPSDDFNQELDTDQEVKAFCELTYGIDMPMSTTTSVKGNQAHPFFKAIKKEIGFVPSWNFNKVLIDKDGNLAATWGSTTNPMSAKIISAIKASLN
ncbi:ATP-binding cassette domain-containing protein [Amylibacter sp.]|nr:ATP-binding cassette domain-containing protein [Amylibacter sp.]